MPPSGASFLNLLTASPRVAASFWRPAANLAAHRAAGLDIAEIRLDMAAVNDAEEAQTLLAGYAEMPVILTIRPQWEGGQWTQSEAARQRMFIRLLPQAAAVDIELAAAIRPQVAAAARQQGKALIFSRHNFAAADSLDDITTAADLAFAAGADVFKNACLTNSDDDLATLKQFLRQWHTHRQDRHMVVIGMGSAAAAARARAELPAQGSRIAFAAIGESSAPGQLSLAATVKAVAQK